VFGLFKKKTKTLKVFISSSFHDSFYLGFTDERRALKNKINNEYDNITDISLDYDLPDAEMGPLEKSLAKVREADLIILFVGSRYGTKRADGKSLTHLEFDEAVRHNKAILAYFFPINENHEDYKDVQKFIKDVEDSKTIAVYVENKYKDEFSDILEAKKNPNKNIDVELKNKYCEKLKEEIVEEIWRNTPKSHIDKHWKKYFLLVLLAVVSAVIFTSHYTKHKLYSDNIRYQEIEKEKKNLTYDLKHTTNQEEKNILKERIEKLEFDKRNLEQVLRYYKDNNKDKEEKIFNEQGPKAAYDYSQRKEARAEIEFSKDKLAERYLHNAKLAYEAEEIDDAFEHYNMVISLSPTYENLSEYRQILMYQNKSDMANEISKKILKLSGLSLNQQANILFGLCMNENISYCKQSIEIYENIEEKSDNETLEYVRVLLYYASEHHNNKSKSNFYFNLGKKILNQINNKEQMGIAQFYYYIDKAIFLVKNHQYRVALQHIKKALKYIEYTNNIQRNIVNRIYYYLLEKVNEGALLEQELLKNLKETKSLVEKYPFLYSELFSLYDQVISYYVFRDDEKAEDFIVDALRKYKKVMKRGEYLEEYISFLMAYQSYSLEMNRNAVASLLSKVQDEYFKNSGSAAIRFTEDMKLYKTKDIINNPSIIMNLDGSIHRDSNTLIKNEKDRNKTLIFTETLSSDADYKLYLKALNYNTIAMSYMVDFDLSRANVYAVKSLKYTNKLIEKDFDVYSFLLIDVYNTLLLSENNEDKFEKYRLETEIIFEKLLKKDKNKFRGKYLEFLSTVSFHYDQFEGKKSEFYLLKSLNSLEEMTTKKMTKYLDDMKLQYGRLIHIDGLENNRTNILYYKKKRNDIKLLIAEINKKTEFESMKIIESIDIPSGKIKSIKSLKKRIYYKFFGRGNSPFETSWYNPIQAK